MFKTVPPEYLGFLRSVIAVLMVASLYIPPFRISLIEWRLPSTKSDLKKSLADNFAFIAQLSCFFISLNLTLNSYQAIINQMTYAETLGDRRITF
jgi:hypothetical protein